MKYCKIHDQEFMDHVPECPICVGERSFPARPKNAPDPRTMKFCKLTDKHLASLNLEKRS